MAAVLEGAGAVLPSRVVTNEMLATRMDTTDEWIRSRTGIRERRAVDPGVATSDLASAAGVLAMRSAHVSSVDLLVLATTTPDHLCPATAPAVAARIGLGAVPAFDVSAVCAGFIYALSVASNAVTAGAAERALVIGAEAYTTIIDPTDRSTAVIFGDGAGAVVLRRGLPAEAGALAGFHLGSDGQLADLMGIPGGGSRDRSSSGGPATSPYFHMQGKQVFLSAVNSMVTSSDALLSRLGWSPSSIRWLVAHQANVRILQAVADRLGISRERAVIHLDRVGNTSAASIPLALADSAARMAPHDRMLLTAFGGGAAWGSAAFTWPDIEVQPPTDLEEVANRG